MKTSIIIQTIRSICFFTILLASSINFSRLEAQVDFNQKQSITIDENSGPILSLKNLNASAFSEMQILNDQSKGFTLGVSGSTNNFFNGFTQTPYLFNGSDQDFQFWSSNDQAFNFHIDATDRVSINNSGLIIRDGGNLILSSPGFQDVMTMNTNSNGQLLIKRNGISGTPIVLIDDDEPRVGINTISPTSELHILQAALPILNTLGQSVTSNYGIKLSKWNIVQNSLDNLSFIYNGIWRSYISSSNGNYVNSSDRRLKENIEPLKPCLEKVMKLVPSRYNYINSQEATIGFIAQDVESVFPELIYRQGKYKALAYDNFTILAIKAIQEQQEIIDELKGKLNENANRADKQQHYLNELQQEISTLSKKIEVFVSRN